MPISRSIVQPVNPVLTNIAVDYVNQDLICDKIFPKVKVSKESGTYYIFSSKDRFTVPNASRRAPGANFQRGQFSVATGTYTCEEDAEELGVDKRLQETALDPFDPFKSATNIVTDRILLRREFRMLSAITNTTTFAAATAAVAAADQWDNVASDPVDLLKTYCTTVHHTCGKWPNRLVIPLDAWLELSEHPVVIDRLKNTDDKIVTTDIFAKLLTVNKENPMSVFVSQARYNAAEEGQTINLALCMGKFAFLAYVTPTPAIDQPSVGYIIESKPFTVENYYEPQSDSDIVRARCVYDLEVAAVDCSYLLSTVIS